MNEDCSTCFECGDNIYPDEQAWIFVNTRQTCHHWPDGDEGRSVEHEGITMHAGRCAEKLIARIYGVQANYGKGA